MKLYFPNNSALRDGLTCQRFELSQVAVISFNDGSSTPAQGRFRILPLGKTKRRSVMQRHLLVVIATLSLVVLTGTQRASAQNLEITLNAPFTFYAGNAKLPAGHYIISQVGDSAEGLLELRGADSKISVFLEVQSAAQADSMPNKTQVLFKKYDDKEILYQIFMQGQKQGYELSTSVHEKRAAKSGATPTKHAIDATSATTKKPD